MAALPPNEITQLLFAWKNGDPTALEKLMDLVYRELHRMAHGCLAGQQRGHEFQTTDLINEAFIKLVGQAEKQYQNREHFFGVAAQAMRHILVDYARSNGAGKRGGKLTRISLDDSLTISEERSEELVALDDALNELARVDPRKSMVVEMRYFGGLSVDETATVLKVSSNTVIRDWSFAKAWLYRSISESPGNE